MFKPIPMVVVCLLALSANITRADDETLRQGQSSYAGARALIDTNVSLITALANSEGLKANLECRVQLTKFVDKAKSWLNSSDRYLADAEKMEKENFAKILARQNGSTKLFLTSPMGAKDCSDFKIRKNAVETDRQKLYSQAKSSLQDVASDEEFPLEGTEKWHAFQCIVFDPDCGLRIDAHNTFLAQVSSCLENAPGAQVSIKKVRADMKKAAAAMERVISKTVDMLETDFHSSLEDREALVSSVNSHCQGAVTLKNVWLTKAHPAAAVANTKKSDAPGAWDAIVEILSPAK